MINNAFFSLLASFAIGTTLGLIFFAGLWWTVRKVLDPGFSPIWLIVSWALRMGFALCGFYAVAALFAGKNALYCIFLALTGFIAARFVVHRLVPREVRCAPQP